MGRERIASAERTAVILKTVRTIKGFCRKSGSDFENGAHYKGLLPKERQ